MVDHVTLPLQSDSAVSSTVEPVVSKRSKVKTEMDGLRSASPCSPVRQRKRTKKETVMVSSVPRERKKDATIGSETRLTFPNEKQQQRLNLRFFYSIMRNGSPQSLEK